MPTPPPLPPNSLIGRDAEIDLIESRLAADGVRLLTLVGPPGVGKTRLAMEVALRKSTADAGEIAFVALEGVSEPDLVPAALARALDVRETAGRALLDALKEHLRPRRLLLVIDNFEHVLAAAPAIADLLAAGSAVQMLVTSRAPLHLRAEAVLPVEPLPLDPDGASASSGASLDERATAPATRLFLERARAVRPSLPWTPESATAIATICARLDGLPLAIELAAARVKIFSPREIAERLGRRLALLTAGSADAPSRHQTLRAAIDWSHELLSDDERRTFRLLSVFAAGGGLDVVAAVDDGAVATLPETLSALMDQSLVRRTEDRDGRSRFGMLETIREYAAEQLVAAGEGEVAWLRLAAWALELCRLAASGLGGPEQQTWLERLDAEHDNLRAALRWTIEAGRAPLGLELAGALWRFWQARGYLSEGRRWLDQLLAQGERAPAGLRAQALLGAATLALDQGDIAATDRFGEHSLVLFQEADDAGRAEALLLLGGVALRRSDYDAALSHAEESLALATAAGDSRLAGRCLNLLGNIAIDQGRFELARERFEAALALAREVGDVRTSAVVLHNLGLVAHRLDDFPRSRSYLEQSLAAHRRLGSKVEIGRNLTILAMVARGMGDNDEALAFASEALAFARDVGNRMGVASALSQLTAIARARGDLVSARAYSAEHLQTAQETGYPMQMLAAVTEAALNAEADGLAARATRLLAASEAMRERMGLAQHDGMRRMLEERLTTLRERLGETHFAAAWAEGTAFSSEEATAHALAAPAPAALAAWAAWNDAAPPNGYPGGLTAREIEVLRLVAAGASNREIADRLVVSERTVEHHVANIYRKIDARGRVDATSFAHRHGLVPR